MTIEATREGNKPVPPPTAKQAPDKRSKTLEVSPKENTPEPAPSQSLSPEDGGTETLAPTLNAGSNVLKTVA